MQRGASAASTASYVMLGICQQKSYSGYSQD